MSDKSKILSGKLAAVWARYHDERTPLIASAEDTIRDDLATLKKTLGVVGLRVMFHDDHDGPGACLDVKERADSEWENWDEGTIGQKRGLLENLHETLEEMAPYLEWNGTEIVV